MLKRALVLSMLLCGLASADPKPQAKGKLLWRSPVAGLGEGTAAVDGGFVFAPVTNMSAFACLDAKNGAVKWRTQLHDTTPFPPVLDKDSVYVITSSCTIYSLSRADGHEQWSRWIAPSIHSMPALCDGKLYAVGGESVEVDLPLVVGGPAGIDPTALHAWLEGRLDPLLERVHRLDVVVAIDEHRRGTLGVEPVGIHDRVALRGRDLDVLQPGSLQPLGEEPGGRGHILAMLRQGADGGDAQELHVVREALRLGLREPGIDAGDGVGHAPLRAGPQDSRARRAAVTRVARSNVRAAPRTAPSQPLWVRPA